MAKRKRRTKAEIEASKLPKYEVVIDENVSGVEKISLGLGDTVEKVLEVTGVGKLAKWILGEDCGCDARKEKLNSLFPYRKPLCLEENEYNWLQSYFDQKKTTVTPSEQMEILKIYNRIFQKKTEPTSCGSCLRSRVNELKIIFDNYETN